MITRLTILFLIFITMACSSLDPNNDPNSAYDQNNGQIFEDTLYAFADSIYRGPYVSTNLTDKLAVGNVAGFQSGFLIKFVLLPESDTLNIDSVYLHLITTNTYGENIPDQMEVDFFRVNAQWDLDVNQLDEWRNPPATEWITPGILKTQDSSISKISIPVDLFNEWRLADDSLNYGLYCKIRDPLQNGILELGSVNSTQIPFVVYYTQSDSGTTIADTIIVTGDASIFNYDEMPGGALEKTDETILVSSGIITNSLLKFDYSSLPEKAIYYSADMILTDYDNSLENDENKSAYLLWGMSSFTDTVFAPTSPFFMSRSGENVKINSTSSLNFAQGFFQELLNKSIENEWLLVSFDQVSQEFSVSRFWGAAADSSVAPKLIVRYQKLEE